MPTTLPPDAYIEGVTTYTSPDQPAPAEGAKSIRYSINGAGWTVTYCLAKPADKDEQCPTHDTSPEGQRTRHVTGISNGISYVVLGGYGESSAPPQWSTALTANWESASWLGRLQEAVVPAGVQT